MGRSWDDGSCAFRELRFPNADSRHYSHIYKRQPLSRSRDSMENWTSRHWGVQASRASGQRTTTRSGTSPSMLALSWPLWVLTVSAPISLSSSFLFCLFDCFYTRYIFLPPYLLPFFLLLHPRGKPAQDASKLSLMKRHVWENWRDNWLTMKGREAIHVYDQGWDPTTRSWYWSRAVYCVVWVWLYRSPPRGLRRLGRHVDLHTVERFQCYL